ncbi:hypothetical protein ACNKHO_20135 [Shigella flexneri]
MDKFRVQGPTRLQGEVTISVLKCCPAHSFAALLAEEPVEIENVPKLKDVDTSMKLLTQWVPKWSVIVRSIYARP